MNQDSNEGARVNTEIVVNHHLEAFAKGIDDLMQDYDESSILLTPEESYSGRNEIRQFFVRFLQNATLDFWNALKMQKIAIQGEIAFIVWAAPPFVTIAADTLLIRDGVIKTQTFVSASR